MQCSLPIAGRGHAIGGCIPSAQAMACRPPGRVRVRQVRIAERSRDRAGLWAPAASQKNSLLVSSMVRRKKPRLMICSRSCNELWLNWGVSRLEEIGRSSSCRSAQPWNDASRIFTELVSTASVWIRRLESNSASRIFVKRFRKYFRWVESISSASSKSNNLILVWGSENYLFDHAWREVFILLSDAVLISF